MALPSHYKSLLVLTASLCATLALPSCAQETPIAAPVVEAAPKADFSQVPGVVVTHSPATSKRFVGSPGIAVLPNGNYVAKSDEFGFGIEQTHAVTRVFGSSDKGKTWGPLSVIEGAFWTSIFVHSGALYMIGTDKEYGNIVIFRSDDGGKSWTHPTDAGNGILRADGHFHCAPVPLVEHEGRLWRAFEDADGPGGWGSHFRAFMMSAPLDSDLLDAKSWTHSNSLERDASWNGNDFNGWLEGNAVVDPDGKMVDVLRVDTKSPDEKAAIVHISDDGKTSTFDPATGFVAFPGGAKKFTIRFDPPSKKYWSLTNVVLPRHRHEGPGGIRNTLALTSSPDLKTWTVNSIVLYHPDTVNHGFQYVDWVFEGDDLIFVSRTAYDDGLGGADSNHNANFLTFHRIPNFRARTMADSVPLTDQAQARIETRDLVATGTGFQAAKFGAGEKAFANRNYVWGALPDQFANWQFTRTSGGEPATLQIKPKRDMTLYVATALSQAGTSLDGWKQTPFSFGYNDQGKSQVTVFARQVKAGEDVTVPQGNWMGTILLVPPGQ